MSDATPSSSEENPKPSGQITGLMAVRCPTCRCLWWMTRRPLERVWKIEVEANQGDFAWYPDMESMRYCFYVKPDAPAPRANFRRVGSSTRR
jgi:hypothetical protein